VSLFIVSILKLPTVTHPGGGYQKSFRYWVTVFLSTKILFFLGGLNVRNYMNIQLIMLNVFSVAAGLWRGNHTGVGRFSCLGNVEKYFLITPITQPKDYKPIAVFVEVFAALTGLYPPSPWPSPLAGEGQGEGVKKTSCAKRNSTRKTIQAITRFSPLTPHG
jgi:hypothetical protein